jgi:DDE domain
MVGAITWYEERIAWWPGGTVAPWEDVVRHAQAHAPHPPCSSGPAATIGIHRLSVPPEVILLAVRWYLRYGLSYHDVEELLAERGVQVDHVTVYRWVRRFTPLLAEAARPCRHAVGDRWWVDETYVKVAGVWRYVYRAVDQFISLPAGRVYWPVRSGGVSY